MSVHTILRSPARTLPRQTPAHHRLRLPHGLVEVGVLAALYVFYSASRLVASDNLASARSHARDVEHVERLLGLHVESWVNSTVSGTDWLAVPMSYWYAALHYVVTPVVMVWVYRRHRDAYPRVRNALVIGTVIGLTCYLLWPTAPPRLMGGHYVDTLAMYAHDGWWSTHASAPAGLGGMTNELAAMPSLHVGWALWAAWAVAQQLPRRVRALPYLYPLGTLTVVVGTGNHWVLDGLVGALVVVAGIVASGYLARSRATSG